MNQNFYDIYDFYYPAWWTQPWAKIILLAFSIIVLGLLIIFFMRRKKQPQLPWEWAEEQLKKISPQSCKNKSDFKKFYYALTSILKQYFQTRFFWPTKDKTDDELMLFLQEQNFDHQLYEYVNKIFTGAVWIKFANEEAIKSQAQEDLGKALEIIKKTKPIDSEKK